MVSFNILFLYDRTMTLANQVFYFSKLNTFSAFTDLEKAYDKSKLVTEKDETNTGAQCDPTTQHRYPSHSQNFPELQSTSLTCSIIFVSFMKR